MKQFLRALGVVILLIAGFLVINHLTSAKKMQTIDEPRVTNSNEITYIPIGDSYTIGLGVKESERWPNILVKHLGEQGINIKILENPSISGYTVQDAIDEELPIVEKLKPDFATILIGANDNFLGGDPEKYRSELVELINRTQKSLTNPNNLVLITIPDYSKSPGGKEYGETNKISKSVEDFNNVIKDEAQKRNLPIVDLFPLSQTLTDRKYFIFDGLHPSSLGYTEWEKVIFPVVYEKLKTR